MIQSIYKFIFVRLIFCAVLLALGAMTSEAQTSTFTYQGRLTDNSMSPTAAYDMEFKLFDAPVGGVQIGTTQTRLAVPVSNGIFTVQLNFGDEDSYDTTRLYLEISVKPAGSGSYTPLAPRQQVTSAPTAVQARNAETAEVADNALALGGTTANQFVQTNDARLTDARTPTSGSSFYIQNNSTATSQPGNFNINGNGRVGNTLTTFNAVVLNELDVQSNITTQGVISGNGSSITNLNANNITTGVVAISKGGTNLTSSGATDNYLRSNGLGWISSPILAADVPNFDAAKITTGTFAAARIPSLDASKITSGTFGDALLSSNIPRRNTANTFTGNQTVTGRISGTVIDTDTHFSVLGVKILSAPGTSNIFAGYGAGAFNTGGVANTFIGNNAGLANTTGSNNTLIGAGANLGADNLTSATAIDAGAVVNSSNTVAMGRTDATGETYYDRVEILAKNFTVSPYGTVGANSISMRAKSIYLDTTSTDPVDAVFVQGRLRVSGEVNFIEQLGGTQTLCYGATLEGYRKLGFCGSSLRYKTNVVNFTSGLDLIRRLRPVTFTWKSDNSRDLGFVAEEVNAVEPLMTTYNKDGQVEGVKYDRISAALVNAVNEQQTQIEQQKQIIERQQRQLDALLKLLCATNQNADVCREIQK